MRSCIFCTATPCPVYVINVYLHLQVSHGAIQFMVYEELKKAARGSFGTRLGGTGELSSAEISFMGAASKLVASIATYPSQVGLKLPCFPGMCHIGAVFWPFGSAHEVTGLRCFCI